MVIGIRFWQAHLIVAHALAGTNSDFGGLPVCEGPKVNISHLKISGDERQHLLRSKGGYIPFKNIGSKFKSSFFPYYSELCNTLPKNVQTQNLQEFKLYTNEEMHPKKYKQFYKGN